MKCVYCKTEITYTSKAEYDTSVDLVCGHQVHTVCFEHVRKSKCPGCKKVGKAKKVITQEDQRLHDMMESSWREQQEEEHKQADRQSKRRNKKH